MSVLSVLGPGIAVVLGGSQGIGAAVVARLVAAGRRTVVVARTADTLRRSCRDIDPTGDIAVPLVCDVTDADAGTQIADMAMETFGGLPSAIVHCSSVFTPGSLFESSPDTVGDVFDTNVVAPFRVIRTLLDRRSDETDSGVNPDPGAVIVINSTAGLQMNFDSSIYSASKIAVRAMTDALRREVNPQGVRVTSIFPGRTDTRMLQQVLDYEGADFHPDMALAPEDVADAVMVALCSVSTAEITELVIRPVRRSTAGTR